MISSASRPLAAVCAVTGWLSPGGRLVLETPQSPDYDNIDHLYCFSAAAMERLLRGAGLAPLRWYDYVDDNYGHHNLACVAEKRIR